MFDSERLDLPSASSAHRRRRCTGSEKLIAELRARGLLKEIPESADAQYGTQIHAAWAGETVQLDGDQVRTLHEIKRLEQMILADWAAEQPYYCVGREERLWIRQGIEPIWSGKFDTAYAQGNLERVLVLDAKTLYGAIEPADYNDQLRELIAGFRFNFDSIQEFRVGIIAPKLSPKVSVADYDQTEAELALRLLLLSLMDAQEADAPRNPGPYCHRCPAVLQCAEAKQLVGSTYALGKRIETGEFALPLGAAGARVLDNIKTAEPILKALKEAYKRELAADPDALPGWRLKPGKKMREILAVEDAQEVALAAGLSRSDFFASTDLVLGRLHDRLGLAQNLRGISLDRRFNELFGHLVSFKDWAPELERITKGKPKNDVASREGTIEGLSTDGLASPSPLELPLT